VLESPDFGVYVDHILCAISFSTGYIVNNGECYPSFLENLRYPNGMPMSNLPTRESGRIIKKYLSVWQGLTLCFILAMIPGHTSSALRQLENRPLAPDFSLHHRNGTPYRLSELRGKVILVNFWATWCPPCRAELPTLQRAWERLKGKDFVVLAITVDENEQAIDKFFLTLSHAVTFPVLTDAHMDAAQFWPLRGLPATFLVDKTGHVSHVVHGALDWSSPELIRLLERLLQESK